MKKISLQTMAMNTPYIICGILKDLAGEENILFYERKYLILYNYSKTIYIFYGCLSLNLIRYCYKNRREYTVIKIYY